MSQPFEVWEALCTAQNTYCILKAAGDYIIVSQVSQVILATRTQEASFNDWSLK